MVFSLRRSRPRQAESGTDVIAGVRQIDLEPVLSREQLQIVTQAVALAATIDLRPLSEVLPLAEEREWFVNWPGEHYTFLAALVRVLKPELVWDVGTYHGASALAMASSSKAIVTNDVVPLTEMSGAYGGLEEEHPHVRQVVGNLMNNDFFDLHRASIAHADLVVVDGPKDGEFEYDVVPKLIETMKSGALIVMDDIRFANMRNLWAGLDRPRIDVGCFAHWTGTGVVFV